MSKGSELSTGEALVGLLEAYGVDTIFGIPGVHNVEMYRALPRSRIRHILVRHEQGAGFMADGYARATGKPGVCFTITGPGLTNILTPLGQAWSDSSNVLVISTALDIADSGQGRGRLHEMIDQRGAAASVTAIHMRAYTPRDLRDAVAKAFAHFSSRRPRPAYIEIPLDLLKQSAGDGWTARVLPERAAPSPARVEAAIAKLRAARSPVLILGGGALHAGDAAISIAEKLDAPIITTTAGKGAVPAGHSLCLGYVMGRNECWDLLAKSDAILCAGSELSETDLWNDRMIIDHDLIRIDLDADTIARPHPAEIAIAADARLTLESIAAGLERRPVRSQRILEFGEPDQLRLMLSRVLQVIRSALPEETVVCSDMTQIAYAANEVFPVSVPRTWIHPVGFGTLGFALPAGIGAKFGMGDKPVAVIIGDYGLQYTVNELGTAAEHNLPLPILLWNNNALGQIRDDMVSKGIQPNAVTLKNPDFQLLAKAYKCRAERPKSLGNLARAIEEALQADGPTLIEMSPEMVHG
ncbi:MAG: 5-guanidino-2-oxopentanoate decarboxylase [Alphaproteobacteria bacterium]|nr:5-guanidino-2-oxopentanoate decarboxylase [Alphaproteobacteria bacterium]